MLANTHHNHSFQAPSHAIHEQHRHAAAFSAALAAVVSIPTLETPDPTPMQTLILTGRLWLKKLREGHPGHFYKQFGMSKGTFQKLEANLRQHYGLQDSKYIYSDKQLAIFLYLARTGSSIRMLQECFQHSGDTVSKYVAMIFFFHFTDQVIEDMYTVYSIFLLVHSISATCILLNTRHLLWLQGTWNSSHIFDTAVVEQMDLTLILRYLKLILHVITIGRARFHRTYWQHVTSIYSFSTLSVDGKEVPQTRQYLTMHDRRTSLFLLDDITLLMLVFYFVIFLWPHSMVWDIT